jgi:hypothetical protein
MGVKPIRVRYKGPQDADPAACCARAGHTCWGVLACWRAAVLACPDCKPGVEAGDMGWGRYHEQGTESCLAASVGEDEGLPADARVELLPALGQPPSVVHRDPLPLTRSASPGRPSRQIAEPQPARAGFPLPLRQSLPPTALSGRVGGCGRAHPGFARAADRNVRSVT